MNSFRRFKCWFFGGCIYQPCYNEWLVTYLRGQRHKVRSFNCSCCYRESPRLKLKDTFEFCVNNGVSWNAKRPNVFKAFWALTVSGVCKLLRVRQTTPMHSRIRKASKTFVLLGGRQVIGNTLPRLTRNLDNMSPEQGFSYSEKNTQNLLLKYGMVKGRAYSNTKKTPETIYYFD